MKCKVCGNESGKYPLCRACNVKKERGEIIKCTNCGKWHYTNTPCFNTAITLDNDKYLYEVKKTLISFSEQNFYNAIKESVPAGFYVFPQINLATFIERTDDARFHNELFRNIDFLITDNAYRPKIIVEINDQTHMNSERRERDEKVQKICEEAGIPIIKLWTTYGINSEYIKRRIDETLSTTTERVHHFSNAPAPIPPAEPEITAPTRTNTYQTYTPPKKGCYIATCVYGSYDCQEVWVLRRFRDSTLSKNIFGRTFIKFYYALSPKIVKYFGKSKWFVSSCKSILDKFVKKLQAKGFDNTPYID